MPFGEIAAAAKIVSEVVAAAKVTEGVYKALDEGELIEAIGKVAQAAVEGKLHGALGDVKPKVKLPDASGAPKYTMKLPDAMSLKPPEVNRFPVADTASSVERKAANSIKEQIFSNLDEMKSGLDKSYKDIKADKPLNSPNLAKWFDNGGSVSIGSQDGKPVWTYIDADKKIVSYVDGYPVFPLEAKHSIIPDIDIGSFTGDRNIDKQLYLKKLEDMFGLTEIPAGYALHHDSKNGIMQLIRLDYHKQFTHAGGHSLFKEM